MSACRREGVEWLAVLVALVVAPIVRPAGFQWVSRMKTLLERLRRVHGPASSDNFRDSDAT